MEPPDVGAFVRWFQLNGGYIDTKVMGISEFPGSGRGGIALSDIPEGHTLFTLPRTTTLSTRTSPLPSLFGLDAWRAHGLHKGWVGLILCMMWEDARAHESDFMVGDGQGQGNGQMNWGPYMRTLPTTFHTPMFWNAEELEELQGTALMGKIGRDDAERTYSEQLIPAIQTSPTLFPPSHHGKWYTLGAYHRAGSRILSRSFTVSRWTAEGDEDEEDRARDGESGEGESDADETEKPNLIASIESSMHVDNPHCPFPEGTDEGVDSNSDNEGDDPSDVAMVPMADILNARWGSENAMLFYEPVELRMVTTKNIKQGEQIFNTYGDPPNSDLLRRYGHVDLVRLPCTRSRSVPTTDGQGDVEMKSDVDVESILQLGNPSDVVEIRADLVVHVVRMSKFVSKPEDLHERIEWWLDEGDDDTFVINPAGPGSHLSAILPSALISLTRLLILSEPEFEGARLKGKLPKGKIRKDDVKDTKIVMEILDDVFKQREGMYIGGTVERDEHLLSVPGTLSERKRHAVIVRLGEKRILRDVRQALRVLLAELVSIPNGAGSGNETRDTRREKKGGNGKGEAGSRKKRATNGAEEERGWKKARK